MLVSYNPKWHGHPITNENVWEYTGYTLDQFIRLSGCCGFQEKFDEKYIKISGEYPSINITIVGHPIIYLDRTVDIKKATIKNNTFHSKITQTGIGYKVFKSQLENAINAGIKQITVNAIGNFGELDSISGYIVWAKFGFTMVKRSQLKFDELMREYGRPEKTVQDMYLNPEMDKINLSMGKESGAEFWKQNGFRFDGIFSLENGSISRRYFDKYCQNKKK